MEKFSKTLGTTWRMLAALMICALVIIIAQGVLISLVYVLGTGN